MIEKSEGDDEVAKTSPQSSPEGEEVAKVAICLFYFLLLQRRRTEDEGVTIDKKLKIQPN